MPAIPCGPCGPTGPGGPSTPCGPEGPCGPCGPSPVKTTFSSGGWLKVVLSLLVKLAINGLLATSAMPSLTSVPFSHASRADVMSMVMYSPRLAAVRGTPAEIVLPKAGDKLKLMVFSDQEPLTKSMLKLPGVVTDST